MNGLFTSSSKDDGIKRLFEEYYARLVHFAFQLVNDKAVAEDIVQDVFIKYWDQCNLVNPGSASIKSYFYTSVKNACLNVLRHNKVTQNHIQRNQEEPVEDSVMSAILRSEVLAEIYRAMETLPESCRQISRLGYLEGKKNNEIAKELGISINTVKTQKQRALKLLRLRLSPELFTLLVVIGVIR